MMANHYTIAIRGHFNQRLLNQCVGVARQDIIADNINASILTNALLARIRVGQELSIVPEGVQENFLSKKVKFHNKPALSNIIALM